jgi:hypothetical protein
MKIALRRLAQSPGFTIVALITLALGIGVNTTAFTVLNRLLFFSQPFPELNRIVEVWSMTPQQQNGRISPGDFCDFREQNTVFEHTALYYLNRQKSVSEPGKLAERCTAMAVTGDFFAVIGIQAEMGRTFAANDDGEREPQVILSHAYWQSHFAGDPEIIGRSLRFDARAVTVIGVMPATLDDPQIWAG